MMITVFTPTYNRAYILKKLYDSLCCQRFTNFEWLIVDDGSTDNTEEIVKSFVKEGKVRISYYKQENRGKHLAINYGVQKAKGELFFIVDSDDYLTNNALERVCFHYSNVKDDLSFCGVSGLKAFPSGEVVGGEFHFGIIDCPFSERAFKYGIWGDIAEVYRTDVLRQYPFPDFKEKAFCPEMLIWFRIAKKYKIRFFDEKIYICDYLPDGLSAKIKRLCYENPLATSLANLEVYQSNIPVTQKIKFAILYWRYAFSSCEKLRESFHKIGWKGSLMAPFGWLLSMYDCNKFKGE